MIRFNRVFTAAVCVWLLTLPVLFGSGRTLCPGFLPENDLKIPVGDLQALGLGEAQFNAVLDKVERVYAPVVAARGATLVIERKWEDPTVNASAVQYGDTWVINMYGGLARHQAVTAEGFALVACHEVGHHLGGYPKNAWATNEGGADYFATLKCMRQVAGSGASTTDPVAVAACKRAYPEAARRGLCETGARGGQSVAGLFAALRPGTPKPRLDTPDPTVVSRTITQGYPGLQCRLDTYFQGALCPKPVSEELSDRGPLPGACNASEGFSEGVRPACWYKAPAGSGRDKPRRMSLPELALGERAEALGRALSSRGL